MPKKLKIAQIAPLWIPVPPKKYGGTELIIYHLCNELINRGHEVTLYASGDSKTKAKLKSIRPRHLLADKIPWTNQLFNLYNLAIAFEEAGQYDIIHSHVDLYETFFSYFCPKPVIHTIHNPLYSSNPNDLRLQILEKSDWANYVNISKSQLALSPLKRLNSVGVVYNGLEIDKFAFNPKGADEFIWIARVDKYKGIENAIIACEKAKVKLKLAGRLDPTQEIYFLKNIKPHLGKNIKFIGEISVPQKSEFFGNARALLYPIEWHEPFGLVMIEAMACGTPVIAYDKGSVREIVQDGVTGFIVNTIPEMIRAIKKINRIDRQKCRERVKKMFTVEKMVEEYEKIYYHLLAHTK